MCSSADWRRLCTVLLVALAPTLAAAQGKTYEGIGRPATAKEIAAWDIDVRPDFKGLPKGAGTVAQGQDVWEGKCTQCHGIFGESGEVFMPLIGGTTEADVKSGHVASLNDRTYPGRTTLMKVATVSTLWDYINRAMPWTAPKSLKPDEVYAVTAYLLHLGNVLPADFELSDRNIATVQARMPNRLGMSLDHSLWPGKGLTKNQKRGQDADTRNTACMSNCATAEQIASALPEHARNAHGNLSEQNRAVGSQHGADTTRPSGSPALPAVPKPAAAPKAAMPTTLLNKHSCSGCHGLDGRIVGPSFREVAKRYAGRADAENYLAGKIRSGGSGVWGGMQMPAQSLNEADAVMIARWLAAGAPR